jgi:hypothetical protein
MGRRICGSQFECLAIKIGGGLAARIIPGSLTGILGSLKEQLGLIGRAKQANAYLATLDCGDWR